MTWLVGRQEWETIKRRLNSVLDDAPVAKGDVSDVKDDKKASLLLCFAISSEAPPEVVELFLECNPTLLQKNNVPLRIATAMNASEQTLMILEEAICPHRSSSPPSVMSV
jgi:hypothetical protein